jgi:hypothetical protein
MICVSVETLREHRARLYEKCQTNPKSAEILGIRSRESMAKAR